MLSPLLSIFKHFCIIKVVHDNSEYGMRVLICIFALHWTELRSTRRFLLCKCCHANYLSKVSPCFDKILLQKLFAECRVTYEEFCKMCLVVGGNGKKNLALNGNLCEEELVQRDSKTPTVFTVVAFSHCLIEYRSPPRSERSQSDILWTCNV